MGPRLRMFERSEVIEADMGQPPPTPIPRRMRNTPKPIRHASGESVLVGVVRVEMVAMISISALPSVSDSSVVDGTIWI